MAETPTHSRGMLAGGVMIVLGSGVGYALSWLLGTLVYAGTYNFGYALRIQVVGTVFVACVALFESHTVRMRGQVVAWSAGLVLIACSELSFFGYGQHRQAVEKVYGAGGSLDRNWRGQVTEVGIGGRPYEGFAADDFARLAAFPHMTQLHVSWPAVGVSEAEQIARCTQIQSLSLSGEEVDDAVLYRLRPLIHLRALDLSPTSVTGAVVPVLNSYSGLQSLDLRGTGVTDRGVLQLRLPKLETLDLSTINISDAAVKHLAAQASFRDLRLAQTEVTHEGIAALAGQMDLETVVLAYSHVSGPGFQAAGNWHKLRSLNLNHTNVNDNDLRAVAGIPNLKDLQLTGTSITDAGLEHCHKLSTLTYLLLNETRVSSSAVAQLRAALPNCQVVKNL